MIVPTATSVLAGVAKDFGDRSLSGIETLSNLVDFGQLIGADAGQSFSGGINQQIRSPEVSLADMVSNSYLLSLSVKWTRAEAIMARFCDRYS